MTTANKNKDQVKERTYWQKMLRVLIEAIIAAAVSAVIALVVNAVRTSGIPLVADEPYDILVPCPEPGGDVTGLDAAECRSKEHKTFFVDARSQGEFSKWRFEKAVNLTFDYLDPTPEKKIQELARAIASSRATRVVVYGDGAKPDTGEQLGKEISGHGIKNVFFVKGGYKALQNLDSDGGGR